MRKMFSKGFLSVAVCIGVGTGSLKADFGMDLLQALSSTFGREDINNRDWWMLDGRDADGYCCELVELYDDFCKDIREIIKGNQFSRLSETDLMEFGEEKPDVFVDRSFSLLQLSRDLYGKVSEYIPRVYDLDNEFLELDGLLMVKCHYFFVRRMMGLVRFCIGRGMRQCGFAETSFGRGLKPNREILAKILKPFAKGDAYKELQLDDNNSQLIQSLHVLSKVFNEFSMDNDEILKEIRGDPLSSWFDVPTFENEMDYWEYVLECSEELSVALQKLSGDVWGRVDRMLSVKKKLSAELKKEALPFFKGEKDVSELLEAAKNFRIKEKEARESKQKAFAEAKAEREKLEREIVAKKKALKAKKEELYKLQESGTEISDKKKELENEIQELNKTVETLKTEINKLSYPSIKSKHKMQRGAAKKGIEKEKHDMAVFANYVQLPDKCRAFQNAFLYYQTIMWNIFTNSVDVIKKSRQKSLKIKEPELTDEKEPELTDEKEPELTDEKEPELTDEKEPELTDDFEDDYYGLGEDI